MSVCDLLEGVWLGVGSPGHKPDCLLAPRVPGPPPVLAVTRFLQADVPTLVGLPFTEKNIEDFKQNWLQKSIGYLLAKLVKCNCIGSLSA